jgi:hypothetical protein
MDQQNQAFGQEQAVSAAPAVSADMGKRPDIITALCGYFFVTWAMLLVRVIVIVATNFSVVKTIPAKQLLAAFGLGATSDIVFLALSIVAVVGLWSMKKWGVYLYALTILGFIVYTVVMGLRADVPFQWTDFVAGIIIGFIVPIVTVAFGFKYLKRMAMM